MTWFDSCSPFGRRRSSLRRGLAIVTAAMIAWAGPSAALAVDPSPPTAPPTDTPPASPTTPSDAPEAGDGSALTQQADATDESRPTITLFASASHRFASGIDGGTGDVSDTTLGLGVDVRIPASRQLTLGFTLSTAASIYEFSGDTRLVEGDSSPWGTIHFHRAAVNLGYAFDERTRAFTSVGVTSAGEQGAHFEDTLTVGGVVGFTYAFSRELTLGVGLVAQTRLEDDVFVLPFPIIEWTLPGDPQGRWRFRAGRTGSGPGDIAGVALAFAPSTSLTLSAGLGFSGVGGEFRLRNGGPVPGGVVRDRSFPVIFTVAWKPQPRINLQASVGVALSREIEVRNRTGDDVNKQDVDPTPFLRLAGVFTF